MKNNDISKVSYKLSKKEIIRENREISTIFSAFRFLGEVCLTVCLPPDNPKYGTKKPEMTNIIYKLIKTQV